MYKVLLVDDEPLIREAISENTRWNELGYELLGTCRNGREAIQRLEEEEADLVLTDICMPYVDGMELTRYLYENHRSVKVIMISGYDDFEYAKTAMKYHVMDYILKPVTAQELAQTLITVREKLDEEYFQKDSMQKIKGAYRSSLPMLQGRFLNSLLLGNMGSEEIRQKLKDYEINLEGNFYMTALVAGDDLASFLMQSDEYKSDLAYFAIYNVAAEIVEAHGFGVSVQDVDERTVLIFFGEENIEEEVLRVAEEIHDSILKFLKIRCTISIGRPVRRLQELSRSFQDARHTLEYRFVLGGDQVIYAQNLPKNQDLVSADMPRHVRGICRAVRSGGEKEVEDEIDCFITNIRQSCLSRNRSIFHIQNLILNVMKELDAAALDETEIFRQERELLNKVYDKDRLSEIKTELTSFCMELARSFRDEKDSYCKSQAIRALDYIEEHYREDVTLNSVCSHLAMSTSYFSSIFKTYTGLTFIEALTRKRIEKAKTLLENTSRKAYEIAWEVGYSDPHYFSSTFKRMTGMSPTEYAKKVR